MTGRVRSYEEWQISTKLKVIEKRKKAAAMLVARKKKKEESEIKNYVCEGNRIVNLQELGKNLKCYKCHEVLSLEKITDETREGLQSMLKIDCSKCGTKNAVLTGKKIKCNDHTFSDVNLTGVLGAVYSGIGCTGRTESADFRVASAVLSKNEDDRGLLIVKENLGLTPGKYTTTYCNNADKLRKPKSKKKNTRKEKLRRLQLTAMRQNLRKKKEKLEGITYESNCEINSLNEEQNFDKNFQCQINSPNDYKIIYFDIETSGLETTSEILQIAAVSENIKFSVYVLPTQSISYNASKVNGLHYVAGELYFQNKKVDALTLFDALLSFSQFLNMISTSCLLVAHNARFDVPRIIEAITSNNLNDTFNGIIGFSDTLQFFKKELPNRKGPGSFVLSTLAHDLLGIQKNAQFHEALFDVIVLQKIVNFIGKKEKLFVMKTTFEDALNNKKINSAIAECGDLKKIVSRDVLRKIAIANITLQNLSKTFQNGGEQEIIKLLSKKCDITNKPVVTQNKKVLNKIILFLQNV